MFKKRKERVVRVSPGFVYIFTIHSQREREREREREKNKEEEKKKEDDFAFSSGRRRFECGSPQSEEEVLFLFFFER